MKRAVIFSSCLALSIFSICLQAQTPAPTPDNQAQINAAQQRQESQAQRIEQQRQIELRRDRQMRSDNLRTASENANVRIKSIGEVRNAASLINVKPNKEQKILLAPDSRDSANYSEFLKQSNTGLIKLFPDAGCEENAGILRVDAECLRWIPNSGFYSFRRNRYVGELVADIRYKDGYFVSDELLSQGILTALGDVPLDEVSLTHNQLKFLTEYVPESNSRAAANQFKIITRGVKAVDYLYKNTWRALENTTYALRSIAYHGAFYKSFQGQMYNLLDGDTRKDIIVVFRVIRKNSDGSLTLLWKELSRKDSPKLIVPKKNKNTRPGN